MTIFKVTVWLNVETDTNGAPLGFFGYQPFHRLATDPRCTFHVYSEQVTAAAERVFAVGNRQYGDLHGNTWPNTFRSVSVGDVLQINDGGRDVWLACAPSGWTELNSRPEHTAGTYEDLVNAHVVAPPADISD